MEQAEIIDTFGTYQHAALKKMAIQFQTWKKKTWDKYVADDKKTPKFTGALVKLQDHWDLFVEQKESEEAKRRSAINKANAQKKGLPYHGDRWLQVRGA